MTALDFERPVWQRDAECRTGDAALLRIFVSDERDNSNAARAKRICATCPVQADCLAYALEHVENLRGVWGGTTPRERLTMRRELGTWWRGRRPA